MLFFKSYFRLGVTFFFGIGLIFDASKPPNRVVLGVLARIKGSYFLRSQRIRLLEVVGQVNLIDKAERSVKLESIGFSIFLVEKLIKGKNKTLALHILFFFWLTFFKFLIFKRVICLTDIPDHHVHLLTALLVCLEAELHILFGKFLHLAAASVDFVLVHSAILPPDLGASCVENPELLLLRLDFVEEGQET